MLLQFAAASFGAYAAEKDEAKIMTLGYLAFRDGEATLENFQKLAEAKIGMITLDMDQPSAMKQLDLAQQVGIKVLAVIMDYGYNYYMDPENYKGLDEMILSIKDHPAIYAYHICDEPGIAMIPQLNVIKNKVEELDPVHPVYINLGPMASERALGTDYYPDFIETFTRDCNFKLLSYDCYPVFPGRILPYWYYCNEVVSATARKYGIPFWGFAATCSIDREHGNVHEKPTMANLRLQVYTNLAYGAQVIEYFTIRDFGGSSYAPLMGGEWTGAYDLMKDINLEMQRRAFVFDGCKVKKTCFTNIAQWQCLLFGGEDLPSQISSLTTDKPALVSFIENGDSEYVVIVNESCWEKFNAELKFASAVEIIDRNGDAVPYARGTASFTVDEGDMLVVKVK